MPLVGFEPTISAGERPQNYVLDRAASGIGKTSSLQTPIFLLLHDKLIEIGSCYDLEMTVEKNKINENFKTAIPCNNCDRPKTTEECGMF